MIIPGGLRLNKLWVPLICLNTHASFLRLAAQVHWQPGTKWQIFQDQEETASQGHCCCLVSKWCLTLVTPWTIAHQAPLSMGFARRDYWSGLPFPPQEIFPAQGLNPCLPHWQPLQRCSQYLIDPDLFPQRESIVGHWLVTKILCCHLEKAAGKLTLSYLVPPKLQPQSLPDGLILHFLETQDLGSPKSWDMRTWGMGHGEHIIF